MGLIHPAYLINEDDELDEIYQGARRVDPREAKTSRVAFSIARLRHGGISSRGLAFISGIGAGLLCTSVIWLSGTHKTPQMTPVLPDVIAQAPAVVTEQPVVEQDSKLEREVELLKRIVSGLVDTVQSISQAREASSVRAEASETFPFPVIVTTDKAHLRKGADRTTASILEVGKDTTLMALDGTDKWLKVSTPRGEEAWVSRSVVVAKEG